MVGQRAARTRRREADNFGCSATLRDEFTIRRKKSSRSISWTGNNQAAKF
jgi:hypothetical protein